MKLVDIKPNTYINFGLENNGKGPKSKVGDHVRISKYEILFTKFTLEIGLKKVLEFKKLQILFLGHIISHLKVEEIVGTL